MAAVAAGLAVNASLRHPSLGLLMALAGLGAGLSGVDITIRRAVVPALVPRELIPATAAAERGHGALGPGRGTGPGGPADRRRQPRGRLLGRLRDLRLRDRGGAGDAAHPAGGRGHADEPALPARGRHVPTRPAGRRGRLPHRPERHGLRDAPRALPRARHWGLRWDDQRRAALRGARGRRARGGADERLGGARAPPGRAVVASIAVWGGAIAAFGLVPWLPAALVLLAVAGAADIVSEIFRKHDRPARRSGPACAAG